MPGCLADAKAVARGEYKKLNADRISDHEPEGCTRKVYRVGDVVYKLDHTAKNNNKFEFEVLTYYASAPWSSPVSLYHVEKDLTVLCMPYYEGDPSPFVLSDVLYQIEKEWLYWAHTVYPDHPHANPDIHPGNWRLVNGQVKLIDAAGCSWYLIP